MKCNFSISNGITLLQGEGAYDLHNTFDFTGLKYTVDSRTLELRWIRSGREEVSPDLPAVITLVFTSVTEFSFQPRNSEKPFTEDDCLSSLGYWAHEDWADGVMVMGPGQDPEPEWLMALEFMSGAAILVQAEKVEAVIREV